MPALVWNTVSPAIWEHSWMRDTCLRTEQETTGWAEPACALPSNNQNAFSFAAPTGIPPTLFFDQNMANFCIVGDFPRRQLETTGG